MEITCKNCLGELSPEFEYCPKCSQKTNLHRLNFHDVFHEAIHYFTHADKGFFHLIRDLALKRGFVARDYVDGLRKRYFPPFNFFLITAAIFVLVSNAPKAMETIDVLKSHPEVSSISDPVKQQQVIGIYERQAKATHFTSQHSNLVALCALPLNALFFWLFYRRARFNFIEHLVANMYMLGFTILVYSLLILPSSYLFHYSENYALVGFFALQLVYFTLFYRRFMDRPTPIRLLKAFGVTAFSMLAWIFISGGIVQYYINSGFSGLMP